MKHIDKQPMKKLTTIVLLLMTINFYAQVDGNLVLHLIKATTAEMNAATNVTEGLVLYNTDEEKMYLYQSSAWIEIPTEKVNLNAGTNTTISGDGLNTPYTVNVPSLDDADADASNEIQTLSVTNDQLTISGIGGNTITLPPISSVYPGSFQITATGSIDIEDLPFEPSAVTFTAYANVEVPNLNSDNGVGNNTNTVVNAFGSMKGFARKDGATSITEQVIYNGGNGTSINDISRYASSSHSIGLRYSNQNGDNLGLTTATVTSFNTDGFTINVDNFTDGILVIYEAYR